VFSQFGYELGCALVGGCRDQRAVAEAQRRAAQIEAERQAAEASRLRKEEEARRKFRDAQQRMLGELRGHDPDSLQLRGFDAPALQVEATRGTFGATELRPRELQATSALGTRGRVRCAVSLLYKANKAYVDINTQVALWEAAYLSNEAANIAGSASYRPNVQCPADPPEVGAAAPTREAEAQLKRIQQSALLFGRVQQQIADIETQKASILSGEEQAREAERKIVELRERIDQLQKQHLTRPPILGEKAEVQQPRDDGALAEAQAALREAEAAHQSSRQLLRDRQSELRAMQRGLEGSLRQLQNSMKDWANIDAPARPPG
jgi:hypothetical protein